MQLVKMELQGFKSFADKTILTFDKGITAIVGPNGSGKSNISDAVRWVMGEQNVRQLRGQKAEDVIFAGTEQRRPRGAAEVSLYFDNQDGSLDVEFSEVVVTRRLFRSGESEYYINKRPCRLKDIHMLFADTGIGQDSMAVIGQNRVDRILNSKPEDRRVIFEEVAGISRYKGRKQEGLRKIAETERNLERIGDMMGVLQERLEPMARQAEKLKTFRKLDQERISYEGTLTLQELRNYERLLAKVENNRLAILQERDETAKELQDVEAKRRHVLADMEAEGETLRRLDGETAAVHNELDGMKSRRDAFAQRRDTLAETMSSLAGEEDFLFRRKEELARQGQNLEMQKGAKQAELAAARQGLALTQSLSAKAEEKAKSAASALEQVTAQNAERQKQLFILRRDVDELRRQLEENGKQCQAVQINMDREKEALAAEKERCRENQERAAALQAEEKAKQDRVAAMRREVKEAEQAAAKAEERQRKLQGYAESLAQRIGVLDGMEQEHEGIGRPAKIVLDAKTAWRPSVCGVVGELCRIPKEYAVAVDVALGAAARYIVTDHEKVAKEAIQYLKERRAGRATFLPLDTVKRRKRTNDEEQAAGEKGILGFVSDVIAYEDTFEPVFSSLLGKTLLADTMETGSLVAGKYGHRLRIVCLDGTQFNAGGSLTGGSVKSREGSFIGRKVLLEELREKRRQAVLDLNEAAGRGKELRAAAEALRAAAEEEERRQRNAEMARQNAELQARASSQEWARRREELRRLEEQDEGLQRLRADIQADLVQKERALAEEESAPSESTQSLERDRDAAFAEAERLRRTLTEQQIVVATIEEQEKHISEQISAHGDDEARQEADWQRFVQRRGDVQQRHRDATDMLEELTKKIALKEEETKKKDAEKEAFYQEREKTFKESQRLDASSSALREREKQLGDRLSETNVQMEKYGGEIKRSEEILAIQGLTRQEAMERRRDGSLKELQEKVAELKERIASLGQINSNAEEEYNAAVGQQQFYRTQCEDLRESKEKLEGIIAEIDDAMSAQFTKAMGEISAHFQQIFSRLFGGGQAKVVLTAQKDILNSGIELWIQPPGKKQQQLSLLSGGERALTVIALLLAFLAYHPAPFCLVDEVDAALDEANVERMARYLKNYSGNTQFIVITHRRKTMEAANTLQGVTMEEKGVSRLLTVKVDELLEKGT